MSKNVKVSPRKVRLVADQIRELNITNALTALMVSRKRGAVSLKKTLESAIANAVNNNNVKKDDLKIKTINVTEGIRYKRYHFAGRGRSRPYVKRTSHISVILEDNQIKDELSKIKNKLEEMNVSKTEKAVVEKPKNETKSKGGKK